MKMNKGPISIDVVNEDGVSFYRFFYRRNHDNNDVYSILLDNINMKKLNLQDHVFDRSKGLENYLANIADDKVNVSSTDIAHVNNEIEEFFNTDNSAVEIILPIKDNNVYSQDDIDKIYNAAAQALGI